MKTSAPNSTSNFVLIVDDEDGLRELLVELFSDLGFSTHTASSGNEAKEYLDQNPGKVSCVVSDLRMPNGTGIDLLKHIRSQISTALPVVLITGFSDLTTSQALALGANGLMPKPFDVSDLQERVQWVHLPQQQRWLIYPFKSPVFEEVSLNLPEPLLARKGQLFSWGRGGFSIKSSQPFQAKLGLKFSIVLGAGPTAIKLVGSGRVAYVENQAVGVEIGHLEAASREAYLKLLADDPKAIAYIPLLSGE